MKLCQFLCISSFLPGIDSALQKVVVLVLLVGLEFKIEVVAEQGEEVEDGLLVHFAAAVELYLPAYQFPKAQVDLSEDDVFVVIGSLQEIVNGFFL